MSLFKREPIPKPVRYAFKPPKNITAYELAKVFDGENGLYGLRIITAKNFYDAQPHLQRFFRKMKEKKS